MSDDVDTTYRMTLSLSVLNHLGIGLYSNVPAVISEAVANAWDADAQRVSIDIDPNQGKISIEDDGHGMSVADANGRYLTVGYERRKALGGSKTLKFERRVMGRKGIGKLSLFSIAKTVEVHSVKEDERHGFRMNLGDIDQKIKAGQEGDYYPDAIDIGEVELTRGTKIILTDMKRRLNRSSQALRRRLARRFSVIDGSNNFDVVLDGCPIRIEDRGYYDKLQYIWKFGDNGIRAADMAGRSLQHHEDRKSEVEVDGSTFPIDGWIGTVERSGQLKDADTNESMNKIVLMVRGKLAQEDILEEFAEGGLYTKYVIGEIHADFLDMDDKVDIATTSRQRIIEDDPRYQALRSKVQDELKFIQGKWTSLRNEGGRKVALENPQIREWHAQLNPDHKIAADRLFGRINQLPIEDDADKRQLFISSVLAFESLRFRNLLHRLDKVSVENLGVLEEVFVQLDDLEASAYYQITRDRLEVIRKLMNLVDDDAKERALQEHLFKHLWLLDPSWERATHTEHMEKRIYTALGGVFKSLPEEQRNTRLDIHYATTAGKHVIIELKRASLNLRNIDIQDQIQRYFQAARGALQTAGKGKEPFEFVCVVGKPLLEWDTHDTEERYRRSLDQWNARIVMYDELIENALEAYQDYVDRADEAGRVYRLIKSIEAEDAQAIGAEE